MVHRHIQPGRLTLAAIDDIIARGKRADWAALRDQALADPAIFDDIQRICAAHLDDPYAQRYHLWNHYAQRRRPA
ncbi:MAG TPA: hypothetical protein PKB10_02275 [Tepidisphaeraceae bacterium]|nr:hypothetical protein [Tepidisphaeraceae bacterium]